MPTSIYRSIAENTYIFTVPWRLAAKPRVVGTVHAVDRDGDDSPNGVIRYRLKNATADGLEVFGVDAKTGQIRIRSSERLKREK